MGYTYLKPDGELVLDGIDFEQAELAILQALEARTNAVKSRVEIQAGITKRGPDGKIYAAHGGNNEAGQAAHAETSAVANLLQVLPGEIALSADTLAFTHKGKDGAFREGAATLCADCRGTMKDVLKGDSAVLNYNPTTGLVTVTKWKEYLPGELQPWSIPAELESAIADFRTARAASEKLYQEPVVGAFICKGGRVYAGSSGQYNTHDRAVGPIIAATHEFRKQGGNPAELEGFLFLADKPPEFTQVHAQMLADRLGKWGVPLDSFYIASSGFSPDGNFADGKKILLPEMLPYTFIPQAKK